MNELVRFGISIPEKLLKEFDRKITQEGYTNRSEAVRDMIREKLVESIWQDAAKDVIAAVTLVYNHHTPLLQEKLTDVQHQNYASVISSLHVHTDTNNCLEVVVLKGKAGAVREMAEKLISIRGVKHGKMIMTTAGKELI